jgi:RNA polymerase sigma factor (sigma-70 family)
MKNKASVLGESDGRLPSETSSSSMEDDLINRMTYEQILAEFDKFPKTTCKVLKLFYANNMTVEQISEKLNVPTGTIKSMLSRTRRKVKKQLNLTS